MSTTLVCPGCLARWKIIPGDDGDRFALCPNCEPPPGGQLWEQTFEDCCPLLPEDAA
jgi:hypothetical protein